jgi:hypothetical protein
MCANPPFWALVLALRRHLSGEFAASRNFILADASERAGEDKGGGG